MLVKKRKLRGELILKALVWTGPRQMEIKEKEMPHLGSNELLIKVSKVGICGSELSGFLGENSLRIPPLIMGHEFSGVIADISNDVEDWKIGELITVNPLLSCRKCNFCLQGMRQLCPSRKIIGIHRPGAFAEYVAVPADACHRVSDEVLGALVEPLACSVRANELADIRMNDNVVVFGAGIIGLMALRVAELRGASMRIIVDTNPVRLEKAKLWGATHTVNPSQTDIKSEIMSFGGGEIDKVIDAVGLPITRKQGIDIVRSNGTIVFVGLHHDETVIPGNVIVREEIQIKGSFCYSDMNFNTALSLINQNMISADPLWLNIRPIEEGKKSFEEQIEGTAVYPKILLTP